MIDQDLEAIYFYATAMVLHGKAILSICFFIIYAGAQSADVIYTGAKAIDVFAAVIGEPATVIVINPSSCII